MVSRKLRRRLSRTRYHCGGIRTVIERGDGGACYGDWDRPGHCCCARTWNLRKAGTDTKFGTWVFGSEPARPYQRLCFDQSRHRPGRPVGVLSFHADGQRAFRVGPPKQPTADIRQYQPDMVALLRLVVERGTGREADLGALSAGKTGTSQNHRDAWFVGFTEPLVVGVWVGNDDETPMNEVTGGKLPARIWRNFMRAAAAGPADSARDSGTDLTDSSSADGTEAPATCNFRACAGAYRSFRPADCTFQPYHGARRFCEK